MDKCFLFVFVGGYIGKKRTFVHFNNKEKELDMAENEGPFSYREDALRYGTYMGLFWIVKFSFVPLGFSVPLLQLLFVICTLSVPALGYLFVRKYRNMYSEGDFGFGKAFGFTLLMYVAAILLVAIAHYVYFQYVDKGYLLSCYQQQVQNIIEVNKNIDPQMVDSFKQALDAIALFSPLQIVCQLIAQNVYCCVLLSFFTALFTMKHKRHN